MTTAKRLGIWMDHASAHLVPYPADGEAAIQVIEAGQPHEGGEGGSGGDIHSHNAEQGQESAYYKHLCTIIKDYDEVLLFGPTAAKAELHNLLKADRHFEQVSIEVQPSEKMTDPQLQAFVRKHFSKN
jgi:hypothetical protein